MAASSIHNVEAATLFVGDDDPTNSQHLVLKNVKLPTLTEKTRPHTGGGIPMSVNLGVKKLESLESSFKLEGINPDVMNKFMTPRRKMFTMRASIRDVVKQTKVALVATFEARMIEADMGEFGTDDSVDSDYKLAEIMFYQLMLGNNEKYYFSFAEGYTGVRVDGVEIFREEAANLGLI